MRDKEDFLAARQILRLMNRAALFSCSDWLMPASIHHQPLARDVQGGRGANHQRVQQWSRPAAHSSLRDFLRRPVSIRSWTSYLAPCHKGRPNSVWSSRMRLSSPRAGAGLHSTGSSNAHRSLHQRSSTAARTGPCSAMLSPGSTRCGAAPIAEEARSRGIQRYPEVVVSPAGASNSEEPPRFSLGV